MQLHSSLVVLQRQQALPHDRVFLEGEGGFIVFILLSYSKPLKQNNRIYRQELHSVDGTMSSMFQLGVRPWVHRTGPGSRGRGCGQKSRRAVLQGQV